MIYLAHIHDWCGHDLAVELTARDTGMNQAQVRLRVRLVSKPFKGD